MSLIIFRPLSCVLCNMDTCFLWLLQCTACLLCGNVWVENVQSLITRSFTPAAESTGDATGSERTEQRFARSWQRSSRAGGRLRVELNEQPCGRRCWHSPGHRWSQSSWHAAAHRHNCLRTTSHCLRRSPGEHRGITFRPVNADRRSLHSLLWREHCRPASPRQ